MKILKLVILALTLFASRGLYAQDVTVIYINTGNSQEDSTAKGVLQGDMDYLDAGDPSRDYYVQDVNSVAAAQELADDLAFYYGDDVYIVAHGVDDSDPYVDRIATASGTVVVNNSTFSNAKNDFYCFEDGGGTIDNNQIRQAIDADTE